MAPKVEDKLITGGELAKDGFRDSSENIRNVILLLEIAELSYILEEPCRILDREVLEFYRNAKLRKDERRIRSEVRGKPIRVHQKSLNKFLKLPVVDVEDDFTQDDFEMALRWCGFHGKKRSSLKKNVLNDEGKLLSDIVGKVLICKHGSHDHISNDMFKLMGYIILKKKINWGRVLYEKIKENLKTPSFGRILTLYMCNAYSDEFDHKSGTPLHHSKKIDYKIFDKWEIAIKRSSTFKKGRSSCVQERLVKDEPVIKDIQEVEETVPPASSETPADELVVADVEGETTLAQDVQVPAEASQEEQIEEHVETFVEQAAKVQTEVPKTEFLESNVDEGLLSTLSVLFDKVIVASKGETHVECSVQEDLINFLDSDDVEISVDDVITVVEEEAHLETYVQKNQDKNAVIEENISTDIAIFEKSVTKERIATEQRVDTLDDVFSDTVLEENLARDEFPEIRIASTSAPTARHDDVLLVQIGKMLEEQRNYFENSLEKVTKEVRVEMKGVKERVNHINAQITGWFLKIEQVVDNNYKALKSFDQKLGWLHEEHDEIKNAQAGFAHLISQELEAKKSEVLNALSEETKKGEEVVANQVFQINEFMAKNMKLIYGKMMNYYMYSQGYAPPTNILDFSTEFFYEPPKQSSQTEGAVVYEDMPRSTQKRQHSEASTSAKRRR